MKRVAKYTSSQKVLIFGSFVAIIYFLMPVFFTIGKFMALSFLAIGVAIVIMYFYFLVRENSRQK